MDWLIFALALFNVIVLILVSRRLTKIEQKIRVIGHNLEQFRVRQSNIKRTYSNDPPPIVDAKARTTRRDTADVPARGARMGMAVKRVKSNVRNPENS